MSDMLPLLRERGAGEHRDDAESRQRHFRIERIHFVSPLESPAAFTYAAFGAAQGQCCNLSITMFLIRISGLKGIFGNEDSVYVAMQYVQKRAIKISFQTNGLHSAPTNSAILVAVEPRVAGITLQPFASLQEQLPRPVMSQKAAVSAFGTDMQIVLFDLCFWG